MAQSKSILVADDEKPLASALSAKLTKEGFSVTVAYNGDEAISKTEKGSFDLIILDLVMPDTDGFAVLASLKEKEAITPIIVLSNLSQESDEKRALDLGATLYLVKSDTPLSEIVKKAHELMA